MFWAVLHEDKIKQKDHIKVMHTSCKYLILGKHTRMPLN